MPTIKTKGIIIKRRNFGEADRILTIYTENIGKVSVMAKGVRKTLSKLSGHIEIFYLSNLMLAEGKNFYTLTGAELIEDFNNLRNNLKHAENAFLVAEAVDKLIEEENPSEDIFHLIIEAIKNIDCYKNDNNLTINYFLLRLLVYIGHKPELSNCVKCGNKLMEGNNFFSSYLGGVVCPNCRQHDANSKPISLNVIKTMRIIIDSDFSYCNKIKIYKPDNLELEKLLTYFCETIAEKEFNSLGKYIKK